MSAYCACTVRPRASTSVVTSRMRSGFSRRVSHPPEPRVESIAYIGIAGRITGFHGAGHPERHPECHPECHADPEIRANVSIRMRVHERRLIRMTVAVVAVVAVAGIARGAQADLTVAALLLLVTVLAVGTLGLPSGLAGALVGFLALNFLFTEPTGSFKIHRTDDVVALAVFAASAALVGFIVQRLSSLSATALQREAEAKVRLDLTNRLLEGADVDDALHSAAAALADLFAFEACTLTAGSPLAAVDE